MRKLYLTYNEKDSKKEGYSYSGDTNPIYVNLSNAEIEAYLSKILSDGIIQVRSINENTLELITRSGEVVVIDSVKLFKSNDSLDLYYNDLGNKIRFSFEDTNIATYKNSLPEGYSPRVNRGKNKSQKYLIDETLATTIILSSGYQELSIDLSDIEMYNSGMEKGR
ncbi:MAG: hypothetical protein HFI49_03555 [Bacilli bacterium]|jgi:hypothetical protein|nr:hypothetical protein [Bacilli bacterium]